MVVKPLVRYHSWRPIVHRVRTFDFFPRRQFLFWTANWISIITIRKAGFQMVVVRFDQVIKFCSSDPQVNHRKTSSKPQISPQTHSNMRIKRKLLAVVVSSTKVYSRSFLFNDMSFSSSSSDVLNFLLLGFTGSKI